MSVQVTSPSHVASRRHEGGFVVPVAELKADISEPLQIELRHNLKPHKKAASLKKNIWAFLFFDLCPC